MYGEKSSGWCAGRTIGFRRYKSGACRYLGVVRMNGEADVFDRLMSQLEERARLRPAGSYTTKLLAGGTAAIEPKFGKSRTRLSRRRPRSWKNCEPTANETNEQAVAARAHTIYEAGDVIYHLWVLLAAMGISLDEVRRELQRREELRGSKRNADETKTKTKTKQHDSEFENRRSQQRSPQRTGR
ncbi:MAG: phosphoribosyl-ATP diphosphatase [Pirellulales bacterium]